MTSCEARALAALVVVSLAGWSSAGCGRGDKIVISVADSAGESLRHPSPVDGRWLTLAPDGEGPCADVGAFRACWNVEGRPALVDRTLPPSAPPTALGFRCTGQGSWRSCRARDDVGPFVRRGDVFEQRHPRQPDDGQWQCSDDSGVTVCTGGEPASGVAPSPVAPGWECGDRRRPSPSGAGARVCVDLSPDYPQGPVLGWRCRWRYEPAPLRECRSEPDVHVVGDACDARSPCVLGAVCADGRCLPPQPAADCVLDSDCSSGACRFGSCARNPT